MYTLPSERRVALILLAFCKALKVWLCARAWSLESVRGPVTWLHCYFLGNYYGNLLLCISLICEYFCVFMILLIVILFANASQLD